MGVFVCFYFCRAHMQRLCFVFCLILFVCLSLGQTLYAGNENTAGTLGDNIPWTSVSQGTCGGGAQRLVLAYEFASFTVDADSFMVFDLATDIYDTDVVPSFSLSLNSCVVTAVGAITGCAGANADLGPITPDPIGTTIADDFQFAFRIPTSFTVLTGDHLIVILEFQNPDDTDIVRTGNIVTTGTNFYFQ